MLLPTVRIVVAVSQISRAGSGPAPGYVDETVSNAFGPGPSLAVLAVSLSIPNGCGKTLNQPPCRGSAVTVVDVADLPVDRCVAC